ncbi:MAG TPA: hypothetical protein VG477_16185 [Thermoanaerobaculia bacterium]|nr:hypothetical protein [Thermoanaerobaculia bacterium]
MSRISLPKLVLVVVLATALAAPSAGWSAGRRFSGDSTWVRGSVTANPLVMLWSYLVGLWGKAGCGLDPNGQCTTVPNTTTKNGCGLDPHGACNSASQPPQTTDSGCGIDPHGECGTGN